MTHDPALAVDGNDFMYYVGDAWINSYTANAANNEAANYTVNFTGTGALVPSNTLPDIGIGVSRSNVAMLAGGGTNVVVTNATGTLSATTSNVKLTTTIANGVVKINAAADCPAGAYIVTITDSGTGTTAYVFAVVSTT